MRYDLHFSIAGFCFLVMYFVFLKLQYEENSKSTLRFRRLVTVLLVADLMDMITCVTISYGHIVPIWLNYVLNVIYFIISAGSSYCLPVYLRYLLHPDGKKAMVDKITNVIMLIYLVLCLSSPATHLLFYFDVAGEYMHGSLYFLLMAVPFMFMFISTVRVIIERKLLTSKQYKSVLAFIIVGIVGVLVQIITATNAPMSYFTNALAIGILMSAFETPDYQRLIKTTKELEESREQLEKARDKEKETTRIIHELSKSANWELVVNEKGEMLSAYWSPEFKQMLGIDAADRRPDYGIWNESLHPDDRDEAVRAFMECLMGEAGRKFDIRYRLIDINGQCRWYRGNGELMVLREENNKRLFRGIIRDIQDEMIKEQLSAEKERALEELEKSQAALKVALEEAEKANKAKSVFLSNMSHDIRTPMNAIIGFTDLAMEKSDNKELVEEYLEKIQSSGDHLLMLINDVLDMSRIESGRMVITPSENDLREIIEVIGEMVQSQIESKKLHYIVDVSGLTDERVLCDRLRLNQILLNCIGNSIKFTPDEGYISIRASKLTESSPEGKGMYRFVITDSGIGMSEDFVKKIFTPFERERSSTISRIQGTGLGMSITKSLIEMMGGVIEVKSAEGKGTTYIITLPFDEVEQGSSENHSTNGKLNANASDVSMADKTASATETMSTEDMLSALKGMKFLVVDDNKTNRMIAKGILESKGMIIDEAEDGLEAVEIISNSEPGKYDGVLMDILMPVMDGYEATDKIRTLDNNELASLPILAMTANAFEEDKEECMRHGMNGHISKPFRADELIRSLYNYLKVKK